MKADQLKATWLLLERPWLEMVVRRGPAPVFATVSGAHLYGFASPDSDVDLRGAFLLPLRDVLGLRPAAETITVTGRPLCWPSLGSPSAPRASADSASC